MLSDKSSSVEIQGRKLDPSIIFSALGDRTRLSLLAKLSGGEMQSIARLSADFILTRQAVTKHLRVLEDAGLVTCNRIGRESQFSFRPEALKEARSYIDEVSEHWDEALTRLRSLVEG